MFRPRRDQPLAIFLAGLAGYVDAIGFLWLGGVFISFMSGNSTQMGVELSSPDWAHAAVPLGIVGLFVVGVILATLLRRVVRGGRAAVMTLVTALLTMAGALQAFGQTTLAICAATLAMGVENSVFEHDGEVSVGLTYMTGTLVKMAQHMASAMMGGPPLGWVPNFLRWLGLVAGAVIGGFVFRQLGLGALWPAAAVAAVLTVVTFVQAED
ncbi:YoaK family protein [Acidisphaera sp. L21]|uniref:YoaK family protein n=1 Tax=Acidisphaera sp. L21 TaxID=1641851 RepID=UPI00131E6333|nr:YoaK family protein [Acidisphaera sp. L21]